MQVQQARNRVKQHVAKRGREKDIVITDRLVRYWWRILNDAVFYGYLEEPAKVHIPKKFLRDAADSYAYLWGSQCDPNRCHICEEYNIAFHPTMPTRRLFIIVLVHEMVHAWQQKFDRATNDKTCHGKSFLIWQGRISRTIGLPLDAVVSSKA